MSIRVIKCGNCGLTGHNKRSCKVDVRRRRKFKRKPSISISSPPTQKKRVIKCGSCGEKGHNKKTCGKLMKCADRILKQPKYEPCSICYEDCCGKTCTLDCGHEFHTKCVFTWFKKNNNCPICRAEVPEMKFAVEQRPFMPSRELLNAMIRMVDDMGEWSVDMSRQRYTQAVFFMMEQTIGTMTPAQYEEMLSMGGGGGLRNE